MADKLKPGTKQWFDRQRRHQHNSFFGHVGMCKANMNSIIESSTATVAAKNTATEVWNLMLVLNEQLKQRVIR